MDIRNPEKCHYCDQDAKYNDLVAQGDAFFVTGVCQKHVKNYLQA